METIRLALSYYILLVLENGIRLTLNLKKFEKLNTLE